MLARSALAASLTLVLVIGCGASPPPADQPAATSLSSAPVAAPAMAATGGGVSSLSSAPAPAPASAEPALPHDAPADSASCASQPEAIASAAALKKRLDALSWRTPSKRAAGPAAALTTDLLFKADVTLDASSFPLPGCNDRICGDPSFDLASGGGGACVVGKGVPAGAQRCKKVRFKKGEVVRLAKVSSFQSSGGNAVEYPRLVVEPRCASSCPSGTYRCAASQECLAEADYCDACLGGASAVCACFGIPKDRPEKWQCTFRNDDGSTAVGHCTQGRCAP